MRGRGGLWYSSSHLGEDIPAPELQSSPAPELLLSAPNMTAAISLWSVNDVATSEVMAKFYQKLLNQGQNPILALREAQLEMFHSGQWKSPYYWAAFTVQGDWR